MNASSRYSNINFTHSFETVIALLILKKNINLSQLVCLWWGLLCNLLIYTFKSNHWKWNYWILVSKLLNGCLLLILIFTSIKNQSHLEKCNCWMSYIRTHSEEKLSKFSNITFAFLALFISKYCNKLSSWILWSLLNW